MARSAARGGLVSFVIAALAPTQLGASCADGVTPDCSNTPECGPLVDAAGEASTSRDAGVTDAPSEVEAGDAADGG